jgi:hypothetical protein
MAKKFVLPKKNTSSYVKLTGFFYYADTLKVKEGRYGRYASFCLVQEQKGERGMKKVYLPVRFFTEVEKIETINLLSYVEIEGFLSSYFGMFIKGHKITVLEESAVQPEMPTFSVKLTDNEMVAAVLRDCQRQQVVEQEIIAINGTLTDGGNQPFILDRHPSPEEQKEEKEKEASRLLDLRRILEEKKNLKAQRIRDRKNKTRKPPAAKKERRISLLSRGRKSPSGAK